MNTHNSFSLEAIATVATPFKQKFAIPRQPNLANAEGVITFKEGFNDINLLKGIENYSHLWLLFIFHQNIERGWKNTVKAPRLGCLLITSRYQETWLAHSLQGWFAV